jgi:hypothetical protein
LTIYTGEHLVGLVELKDPADLLLEASEEAQVQAITLVVPLWEAMELMVIPELMVLTVLMVQTT